MMKSRKEKNRKNTRIPILFVVTTISIVIIAFLAQGTLAKYVFEWYSGYSQADALKFYFGSNYLVAGQGNYPTYEYVVDDISNAAVYFEIYNYADDLKISEVAVEDIEFSVEAYILGYGQNVSDSGGMMQYAGEDGIYNNDTPVWIQVESDEGLYKAMVEVIVPESGFDDGVTPTIKVIATATDPYVAELAALFEIHTSVNQDEVKLSVKDTANNNVLILTIETMNTSGVVTIFWTEEGLYADKTNALLSSVDNEAYTFITKVLEKYSTYEVIFLKNDSTENYQETVTFTMIENTGGRQE